MTLLRDFRRVSRSAPCPICGKPDWCLAGVDGSSAICARVESPTRAGEAGWLHRLVEGDRRAGRLRVRTIRTSKSSSGLDGATLRVLAAKYAANLPERGLHRLATDLGLCRDSLLRLRIGWTGRAWSFPMTDAQGQVRGIRLRHTDGRKGAIKGGREGLFIPDDLRFDSALLLAEGPTDCAALLDFGFESIGRPNCRGGRLFVIDFIKRNRISDVVVVADGDEPGQRGAAMLASSLACRFHRVRVIAPPASVKDIRAWKVAGGTAGDVQQVIDGADVLHLGINVRRISR